VPIVTDDLSFFKRKKIQGRRSLPLLGSRGRKIESKGITIRGRLLDLHLVATTGASRQIALVCVKASSGETSSFLAGRPRAWDIHGVGERRDKGGTTQAGFRKRKGTGHSGTSKEISTTTR